MPSRPSRVVLKLLAAAHKVTTGAATENLLEPYTDGDLSYLPARTTSEILGIEVKYVRTQIY